MNNKWASIYVPESPTAGASRAECRERAAAIKAAQDAQRHQAKSEQASQSHSAEERIRLWESLHGAQLPRRSDHAVLAVIAAATELTLEQVKAEQRLRFDRTAAASVRDAGDLERP